MGGSVSRRMSDVWRPISVTISASEGLLHSTFWVLSVRKVILVWGGSTVGVCRYAPAPVGGV
jgi:hypothetical protein